MKGGIIIYNLSLKKYLAWCEMQPVWVEYFEEASVQDDIFKHGYDILTLLDHRDIYDTYIAYIVDGKKTRNVIATYRFTI